MTAKAFDCIEMKRKGARIVYEEVKGMTTEQEIEYWRGVTDGLAKRHRTAERKRGSNIRRSA